MVNVALLVCLFVYLLRFPLTEEIISEKNSAMRNVQNFTAYVLFEEFYGLGPNI